jgi:hypothetical protein
VCLLVTRWLAVHCISEGCARTYRHPPRIGKKKLYLLQQASRLQDIARKAHMRLTGRYRALSGRGKKTTAVCTALHVVGRGVLASWEYRLGAGAAAGEWEPWMKRCVVKCRPERLLPVLLRPMSGLIQIFTTDVA